MASGINSTFRQVGIATGTAALGAIFQHLVDQRAEAFAAAAQVRRAVGDAAFSDFIAFGLFRRIDGGEPVLLAGREAFLHGLHSILLLGGIVALVGALLCALLVRSGDVAAPG